MDHKEKIDNTDYDTEKTVLESDNDPIEENLEQYLQVPKNVIIEGLNKEDDVSHLNSYFILRKKIYEETLAPELVKNETKKREHKELVVNKLFRLLKWQFVATYFFTFLMIVMIATSSILSINNDVLNSMFSFMKFYISSILAELVAILFFIVKQVFDKSIVELFKNFDKDHTN